MSETRAASVTAPEDRDAISLGEIAFAHAWNVRGDSAQPPFVDEVARLLGLSLPCEPMTSASTADSIMLWLGPRSWLFVASAQWRPCDFDATRRSLNARGGALFDVSASYAAWSVEGTAASRALNRGCPIDLHPRAFPAGHCAQSLLGHVNALIYKPAEPPVFIVMVARSLAADAWDGLCASAASDGYRIVPPREIDVVLRPVGGQERQRAPR